MENALTSRSRVEDQFERDFIAYGGPRDMMLVSESENFQTTTLFVNLPRALLTLYSGFETTRADQLPKHPILLVADQLWFEEKFGWAG
jgi:hypothetical protein